MADEQLTPEQAEAKRIAERRIDAMMNPEHSQYENLSDIPNDEYKLRTELFRAHGAETGHYLYGDDGERMCNECGLDFARHKVDFLINRMSEDRLFKLAKDYNKARTEALNVMIDHEIAAMVNAIRDEVQRICPNAPQMLREVISKVVTQHLKKTND